MILCVGDILVDMFGAPKGDAITFDAHAGGAAFNVAVNVKQSGAKVGFVGRVGDDLLGKFLKEQAGKVRFDYLDIQTDKVRNTTVAYVTVVDGERDFTFSRHDTTDYNIDVKEIDFGKYGKIDLLLMGSTMLSEPYGRKVAKKLFKKAKSLSIKVAFDVNFRLDMYEDFNQAVIAYKPYVENADVVKFSNDELTMYTGIEDIDQAANMLVKKDQLLVVTCGANGSKFYYNGLSKLVPTEKLTPVDTTGAGDAFFGKLLSELENKEWTEEVLENALAKANAFGARATQFVGAIKID